ncbi:MAG TPA: hypothetical protein VM123_06625 [archaeon]|nr:hypothetical protein [archaeon]
MEELSTVPEKQEKNLQRWLFNPFYYLAGGKALVIGVGFIIATGIIAFLSNSRFDGVLDIHSAALSKAPIWVYVSDGMISWIIMGILLLIGGKIISPSRVRALDVFGTQALARFPCLITAVFLLLPGYQRIVQKIAQAGTGFPTLLETSPADVVMFSLTLLAGILMIIWMVALMYRAYAVSCNVSGGKAAGVFITALILGEVVSKIILISTSTLYMLK